MSSQYIFTMHRLSKVHPPDKTVLDNLTLAFYPGAKIGVLGYNGAGKSTLLRIMAGVDEEYRGEAALAPGATVGMLEQEPALDESKDVKGNVEDGVAETKALLDRFNELAANYSDETAEEFGRIQAQIEAADAWNLDTQLEYAMDALRLPPPDADVSTLSGGERRRVALCRLLLRAPDLLLLGRAHQPSRRRVGRLAGAAPERVQGRDRRRHPRPLLPRQRRRLDPRARPRQGHPLPGQLLELARAEAGTPGPGRALREGPSAHDRGRAGVGADEPQGQKDEVQGPSGPLRGAGGGGAQRQARGRPDPHPAGSAPRREGADGERRVEGLRRAPADRVAVIRPPARGDRRRDRPQRRRQDDALQDGHGRGQPGQRHADRRATP